jgi:hypothetical protein
MNLICFPHYTCGGLLGDILNDTFSQLSGNGGIANVYSDMAKIGDTNTVFTDYDPAAFQKKLQDIQVAAHTWIGTHIWPGKLDLTQFNSVLMITTTTAKSKLYRWARAYYLYYTDSKLWSELQGQDRLDKERETAKNYLIPFQPIQAPNVTNIEFAEIVECRPEFLQLVKDKNTHAHLDRWRKLNSFLYESDIWASAPFQRFYEAELEVCLSKHYVY